MNNPCEIWFRVFVIAFIAISSGTLVWLFGGLIFQTFFKGGNFWQHRQEKEIRDLEQKLTECNENEND